MTSLTLVWRCLPLTAAGNAAVLAHFTLPEQPLRPDALAGEELPREVLNHRTGGLILSGRGPLSSPVQMVPRPRELQRSTLRVGSDCGLAT